MGKIISGVPNAVVWIGGLAAAYYFFVYDDTYAATKYIRARSEREKYLQATHGQRVKGRAGEAITSRFNTRSTGGYDTR